MELHVGCPLKTQMFLEITEKSLFWSFLIESCPGIQSCNSTAENNILIFLKRKCNITLHCVKKEWNSGLHLKIQPHSYSLQGATVTRDPSAGCNRARPPVLGSRGQVLAASHPTRARGGHLASPTCTCRLHQKSFGIFHCAGQNRAKPLVLTMRCGLSSQSFGECGTLSYFWLWPAAAAAAAAHSFPLQILQK